MKKEDKEKPVHNSSPLSTDYFWAVNKEITHLMIVEGCGIEAAAYLSYLVSLNDWLNLRGFIKTGQSFYRDQKKIKEVTGISEIKQKNYLDIFNRLGFVTSYKKGTPSRFFYKINFNSIQDYLNSVKQRQIEIDFENYEDESY